MDWAKPGTVTDAMAPSALILEMELFVPSEPTAHPVAPMLVTPVDAKGSENVWESPGAAAAVGATATTLPAPKATLAASATALLLIDVLEICINHG